MQNNKDEELLEMNTDAAWDMWLSQAESIPESKLEKKIDNQYKENKKIIEEISKKGTNREIVEILSKANDAVHDESARENSKKEQKELIIDKKRNRLAGLMAIGNKLQMAALFITTKAKSTYNFIVSPVLKIERSVVLSDIKVYQKYIKKVEESYKKDKEKIDKKAQRRLRGFNLKNMRQGKPIYDSKVLPYTQREQDKINYYEGNLKYANYKLVTLQERVDRLTRRLNSYKVNELEKKGAVHDKQNMNVVKEDDTKQRIDEKRPNNHNNEKRDSIKRLTDEQYQTIKKNHLTEAQFKTAIYLVKEFPTLKLEEKLTNDIPANKYPYLAKAYAELHPDVSFETLKILTLSQLSSIVKGIEYEAISRREAVDVVDYFISKQKENAKDKSVEQTKTKNPKEKESGKEEPQTERNLEEDIKEAEIVAKAHNERPEVRKAMATKAVCQIETILPVGETIDFEVSGNAYRATKLTNEKVQFMKYDFEKGQFEDLTRLQTINKFMKEPAEIRSAIDAQLVGIKMPDQNAR